MPTRGCIHATIESDESPTHGRLAYANRMCKGRCSPLGPWSCPVDALGFLQPGGSRTVRCRSAELAETIIARAGVVSSRWNLVFCKGQAVMCLSSVTPSPSSLFSMPCRLLQHGSAQSEKFVLCSAGCELVVRTEVLQQSRIHVSGANSGIGKCLWGVGAHVSLVR